MTAYSLTCQQQLIYDMLKLGFLLCQCSKVYFQQQPILLRQPIHQLSQQLHGNPPKKPEQVPNRFVE